MESLILTKYGAFEGWFTKSIHKISVERIGATKEVPFGKCQPSSRAVKRLAYFRKGEF